MDNAQHEANSGQGATARHEGDIIHHLVTFNLGKEEYGVDIGSVQEIIRATDITPVPGAPVHVRGVINLRGKIIPSSISESGSVLKLSRQAMLSGSWSWN